MAVAVTTAVVATEHPAALQQEVAAAGLRVVAAVLAVVRVVVHHPHRQVAHRAAAPVADLLRGDNMRIESKPVCWYK